MSYCPFGLCATDNFFHAILLAIAVAVAECADLLRPHSAGGIQKRTRSWPASTCRTWHTTYCRISSSLSSEASTWWKSRWRQHGWGPSWTSGKISHHQMLSARLCSSRASSCKAHPLFSIQELTRNCVGGTLLSRALTESRPFQN